MPYYMLGGPRTPSTTTDADLGCWLVKNALLFVVPKIRGELLPPIYDPLVLLLLLQISAFVHLPMADGRLITINLTSV